MSDETALLTLVARGRVARGRLSAPDGLFWAWIGRVTDDDGYQPFVRDCEVTLDAMQTDRLVLINYVDANRCQASLTPAGRQRLMRLAPTHIHDSPSWRPTADHMRRASQSTADMAAAFRRAGTTVNGMTGAQNTTATSSTYGDYSLDFGVSGDDPFDDRYL